MSGAFAGITWASYCDDRKDELIEEQTLFE
jgi:hypothetical protein